MIILYQRRLKIFLLIGKYCLMVRLYKDIAKLSQNAKLYLRITKILILRRNYFLNLEGQLCENNNNNLEN